MCPLNKKRQFNIFEAVIFIALAFLAIGYIILPFGYTVLKALDNDGGYSLDAFKTFFSNPNYIKVIINTVVLGILSVLTCGIVGTALALYTGLYKPRFRKALHIMLLSPMMIPGVITVISFIQLYAESGMITKLLETIMGTDRVPFEFKGLPAVLFIISFTQYVYFYLNVYISLKYTDLSLIEAAKSLGASSSLVFKDVIFPVIRPALISSAIVTFASGISAFSAPNLVGGSFKVLSTQIVKSKANNQMAIASVEVIVLFLISFVVMMILRNTANSVTIDSKAAVPLGDNRIKLESAFARVMMKVLVSIVIVLIAMPFAAIIYLSFIPTASIMKEMLPTDFSLVNYATIFNKPRVLKPLLNSLYMSGITVVMGLLITIPGAYLISKKNGIKERALRAVMMLPWTMPASVTAINLINAFSNGNIFSFGNSLTGGFFILPVAYTITSIPLLLSTNETTIKALDSSIMQASQSLGAGSLKTLLKITIPNIGPAIFAGSIMIFIRTVGEYTMSALLYGVYNRPISISIITNMQEYKMGISLAYGVIIMAVCYIALWLVFKLDKNRYS